jgi:Zn-dependent protease
MVAAARLSEIASCQRAWAFMAAAAWYKLTFTALCQAVSVPCGKNPEILEVSGNPSRHPGEKNAVCRAEGCIFCPRAKSHPVGDHGVLARLISMPWLACRMDGNQLIIGLIQYVALVVMLTFHEFGHAWMASKCGDDTAKSEGRVSLNPLVHIDPIGTVVMPLMMIFLSLMDSKLAAFLIGWAKPVPVNPNNLRNPKLDDILITMAGPWMNLLLAVVFIGGLKGGILLENKTMVDFCFMAAVLNLALFFFNLLPIPPLDGSRIMRVAVGMSHETYFQFARYGIFIIILVMNLTPVPDLIGKLIKQSLKIISGWFGIV